MKTRGYELFKEAVEGSVREGQERAINRMANARLIHYGLVALLRQEIGYVTFTDHLRPVRDQTAFLRDPTGHVPDSHFKLGAISVWLGSGDYPARIFLPEVEDTDRQFTFRLDRQEEPLFEIYDDRY